MSRLALALALALCAALESPKTGFCEVFPVGRQIFHPAACESIHCAIKVRPQTTNGTYLGRKLTWDDFEHASSFTLVIVMQILWAICHTGLQDRLNQNQS